MFKSLKALSKPEITLPTSCLLLLFGLWAVLATSCSSETKDELEAKSRVIVLEDRVVSGYSLVVLKDTKTGDEYIAYNHGLVRLREPSEK